MKDASEQYSERLKIDREKNVSTIREDGITLVFFYFSRAPRRDSRRGSFFSPVSTKIESSVQRATAR